MMLWKSLNGFLASRVPPKLEPPKYGLFGTNQESVIRPGSNVSLETIELISQRKT
jgi:hypothetical protein